MVPTYPFEVQIEFRPHINRKAVKRGAATLDAAMAVYAENIGRQDVYRVTVTVILHQALATPLLAKRQP